MTVQLPAAVEEQIRRLAEQQGRDVDALVAEAVRLYIEAASISDVTADDVGAAQMKLVEELGSIPPWQSQPENGTHEAM